MFNLLQFQSHELPNCVQGKYKFTNDWEISVVAGPPNSGLYGNIDNSTYEVAIIRPNGHMTEDVSGWNTQSQVSAMMWVLSQL